MSYLELIQYGHDAVEDALAIAEKQLAKMYLDAFRVADTELTTLYAKLGDKLDLPEAQKYKRLENLKKNIADEYKKLTGKSIALCEKTSEASYVGAYQSSWFGMEKALGIDLAFGVPSVGAIRASVFSEYSGAAFPYRFGKLYTGTVDKVAETITRGLATGHGYAKTAREVKDIWSGSLYNAIRVIRTESTRNFTEGNLAVYERARENGIEGVETWLATNSARTRDSHARLNGKQADKNGYFYIGSDKARGPGLFSLPENSINCRCSTYYKLSGVDHSPDLTYNEWKKEYIDWTKESPRVRKA